ncbi:plastocyanin [Sporolactobacillus sp. THM7-4]|nr:plastocyanin [Sporolactobacillus sp. THM7-4]
MKMRITMAALSVVGIFAIGLIIFGAIQTVSAVSIQNKTRTQAEAAQTDRSDDNVNPDAASYDRYGYGMMGGGYGMMNGARDSYSGQASVTESAVQKDIAAAQKNAHVDKKTNTITYSGNSVTLVIAGGPEKTDGKFVIDGLVNPKLVVTKGADVTVEFVNEDADMPHAFEITDAAPPYDYMSMMDGGIYPGSIIRALPKTSGGHFAMATTTFKAIQPGTFYYICQYPGHAQKGMYGKLLIK